MKPDELAIGASIACNGICMTMVGRDGAEGSETVFEVDAAPETLEVTTASEWDIGRRINLERPLKVGDELSGHMVSGHVDAWRRSSGARTSARRRGSGSRRR